MLKEFFECNIRLRSSPPFIHFLLYIHFYIHFIAAAYISFFQPPNCIYVLIRIFWKKRIKFHKKRPNFDEKHQMFGLNKIY